MKRITSDERITVRGRKCGRTSNLSRQPLGPTKTTRLLSLNREVCPVLGFSKLAQGSRQNIIAFRGADFSKTARLVRMSAKIENAKDPKKSKVMSSDVTKTKPIPTPTEQLSSIRHERDDDLKETLFHMEEKFTSASEELQAAEEELTELRLALSNAKRTIDILRAENEEQAEKIKSLSIRNQQNVLLERRHAKRNVEVAKTNFLFDSGISQSKQKNVGPCMENLLEENKNLQKIVNELNEEKLLLDVALENSKTETSRVLLENNQLKMEIEAERKEWDQMQRDLLVAVKVANDFKTEAQKEMMKLSERISELQKRRSTAFNVAQVSLVVGEKPESWEDRAWQRLMLGCERGSRRNALLRWCQKAVAQFPHVEITNFSTSWVDGQALCYLLAAFYPEKLNITEIRNLDAEECLKIALGVANALGVEMQVTMADFRREDRPDWSLIMRFILNLYHIISGGSNC